MRLPRSFFRRSALHVANIVPSLGRRVVAQHGLLDDAVTVRRDGSAALADFAFDAPLYAAEAGVSDMSEMALSAHYLLVGSQRGLKPAKGFDPAQYRRENPDVGIAGYEAFSHARSFGGLESRIGSNASVTEPSVPSLQEVLQNPNRKIDEATHPINIIVPVYKGCADVLRTISHVMSARNAAAFDLVVVDDASPETEVREALDALARNGKIRLIRNDRNRGFVASVNRGIALDPDRDVVLLNSDTAVFDGWLDRVVKVLASHRRCGTVTPMSNAATILSYPIWLRDNVLFEHEDPLVIDRRCRDLDIGPMEIPTAVGYCMAIRRACIDAVGLFDEQTFGLGYGEENDFCRRAVHKGWTNLAAPNVFVWHKGGGAFGAEKTARVAAAQTSIERLHPGYRDLIGAFIRRDPLRTFRAQLDARMLNADPRAKVLVDHRAPPAASDDRLRMACIPDISPYFGSYRLVTLDGPRAVNLPRVKRLITQAALGESLMKIEAAI